MDNNQINSLQSINNLNQKQSNATKSYESLFVGRQLANLGLKFEIDRIKVNKYIEKYSSNKNEIDIRDSLINLFRENDK
jgi:hypothetical protein